MKAVYGEKIIAQSNNTIIIEKDHYFPVESVNMDYLKKGNEKGGCDLREDACYYDVEINGNLLRNVASSFSRPAEAAEQIQDYIVFKSPIEIKD